MATFDPYRIWLGIPPDEQPPNHYRLLGIGLFESDPEVISNAADRQMVHLRRFQSGRHAELSQRLLNELASARVCLLDPPKKAEYDAGLWARIAPETSAPTPPPVLPPPPPPPTTDVPGVAFSASLGTSPLAPVADLPGTASFTRPVFGYRAWRKRSAWHRTAATLVLLAMSLVLAVWMLNTLAQQQRPEHAPVPIPQGRP